MADPHKYQQSYDLVNQYDWTSVARGSQMRNEAPAAYVTAYELEFSQLRSFIDGYLNILSPTHFGTINKKGATSANPGLDFYKRLYGTSTEPITRFSFPFFSDNIRGFTSEFSDSFSPISQRGAKVLGGEFLQGLGGAGESIVGGAAALANAVTNIGDASDNSGGKSFVDKVYKTAVNTSNDVFSKLLNKDVNLGKQTVGAPGTYIETPQFYQYSNTDNGLELSFALSNTLNDDAKDQNHKFITDFTRMNRPYRTGPIGMTFPAIYNVVIPGQRYIMWASLESFNVGLLGMRRRIKLPNGGSRVIPEAYSCQFTFKSLTIEAANFMDEIDKFGSFAGDADSYSALKKAEEKSLEGIKQKLNDAAIDRTNRVEGNKSLRDNPGGSLVPLEGYPGVFIDMIDNSLTRGRTVNAAGRPIPDPRQTEGKLFPVSGPGPHDPSYDPFLHGPQPPITGPGSGSVGGDPAQPPLLFPDTEAGPSSQSEIENKVDDVLRGAGIPIAPDGPSSLNIPEGLNIPEKYKHLFPNQP